MPVVGAGQQHAGEERAERHRQSRQLGQPTGGQGDQQGEGGEGFGRADAGGLPEQLAQDSPAEAEDHNRRDQHLEQRETERGGQNQLVLAERQRTDQEGRHREVLYEEHAESAAPELAPQLAAIRQHPQHDRRRRERQRAADHYSRRPACSGPVRHARNRSRGHEDL